MNNKPTILFFDSGVGGFSVYREVRQQLPDCHYLYCFDNAFFPYSEKDEQTLIERALFICQKIHQTYPIDLIVVACNTASTVVLPALRQHFAIPVVGTVPAIKPAGEISQSKHIGLLATKGTVKRPYVNDLIARYASHCQVERIGSTKLVEIAEQKLHGNSVDILALRNELTPWLHLPDLDTLILGCTHFPLIKQEIALCLPQVKHFIEPGYAIAKRVAFLLNHVNSQVTFEQRKASPKNLIFCTQDFPDKYKFQQVLKRWGFDQLHIL